MQPIDMMSALVTGGTGALVGAAMMLVAMQGERSLRRPLAYCLWGFVVLGIGLSQNAFSDRSLRAPIFIGAAATLLCTALVARGMLEIATGRAVRHPLWLDLAATLSVLGLAWTAGPHVFAMVFHGACLAVATLLAFGLRRALLAPRNAAEWAIAVTMLLYAATWAYGLVTAAAYAGPELRHLMYMPEPMLSLYAVTYALLPLVVGALVLNLANARLGERLHRQASTDELTRLLSRRALNERARPFLDRAVAQGRGVALLLVDADHFKRINDAWGHEAGDAVLAELARRLRTLLPGALVSRYGGEEFLALIETATPAEARGVAEQLRAGVAATPVVFGDRLVPITVSAGLVRWAPQDGFGDTLRRADLALYEAKRTGRNRIVDADTAATTVAAV